MAYEQPLIPLVFSILTLGVLVRSKRFTASWFKHVRTTIFLETGHVTIHSCIQYSLYFKFRVHRYLNHHGLDWGLTSYVASFQSSNQWLLAGRIYDIVWNICAHWNIVPKTNSDGIQWQHTDIRQTSPVFHFLRLSQVITCSSIGVRFNRGDRPVSKILSLP